MPTCKKCNSPFPNKIWIEGKQKSLLSRKYCLECSSYKGRNTRKLEQLAENPNDIHMCLSCNREFCYQRAKGGTRNKCNSCWTNAHKTAKKIRAVEYKGGACICCGYSRCLEALTFHHEDPNQKDFVISGNHTRAWETIQKELDKCVLLCNRCHAEIHAGVRDLALHL